MCVLRSIWIKLTKQHKDTLSTRPVEDKNVVEEAKTAQQNIKRATDNRSILNDSIIRELQARVEIDQRRGL